MINPGDYRRLMQELKAQGWVVTMQTNGHHQAVPPSKDAKLVHFSESKDPRAWHNMIAQLRKSGFREEVEKENQLEHEHTQCPKCRGDFDVTLGVCMGSCTEPEEVEGPLTLDDLFKRLKDAKDWHAVAEQDLASAYEELTRAQEKVEQAKRICTEAVGALTETKKLFDAAFKAA